MAVEERQSSLDYAEQLARIERSIAETRKFGEERDKFAAEQHRLAAETQKLGAEQLKLGAEQQKLYEEALKFKRDRSLAPLALFSGLVGGALAATVAHFLH